MRIGEDVTFGASGLDRCAALRSKPDDIARLFASGRVLALWRGKPLFQSPDGGLAWVPAGHPLLAQSGAAVFLGLEEPLGIEAGRGSFAVDLSAWQPEIGSAAEQSFFDSSRQGHPTLPGGEAFEDLRNAMTRLSPREAELAATARAILQWHQNHGFCATCGARTDVTQAGWQRSCAPCGAQHFPRTDPVVIMLITHGNRVLLGRNAAWPEGMYSLLAGFVEPGETVENAVRREVMEEAGVQVGPVRYLASQPWPFPANLMLGCAGEAISDAITLDPVELQDAFWISREDLVQVFAGRHPQVRPPRNGAIAAFLMRNWLADRLV